jgi:hypothetical protein
MFGKPGEGVHSWRLFNIAVVDVLGTVVIAWGLATVAGWDPLTTLAWAFALGVLAHWVFCVDTTVHKFLTNKLN